MINSNVEDKDLSKHIKKRIDYWDSQARKVGKPRKVKSPEQMWEVACQYFKECDSTPWVKVDYRGKNLKRVEIPTCRPYTIKGLYAFFRAKGMTGRLEDYRKNRNGRFEEYSDVVQRINDIIKSQKLEGALVGAFNASLVSYELGIGPRVEKSGKTIIKKQVFKIAGQEIELG
jgi:hypothetical protein